MEEVKENTRASITSGLNRNTILNRPSAQPTVGAGGQYQVNVQAQPEGKFTKLAKGLSAFNTALGAVAESNVAASELATQQASEMSLEEIEENSRLLKETEDKMYEQNSFIDRLTRKGKMSIIENPLTFSRAQRAAGTKLGTDRYKAEVNKRLQEAQKEYRRNGTEYVIEDIQRQVYDEILSDTSMDEGSSMQRGFSEIASKVNTETRQRYFDEQSRAGVIREVGNVSNEVSTIFGSSGTIEEKARKLMELKGRQEHIGGDGFIKAIRVGFDDLASRDPELAMESVTDIRDKKYSNVKLGGFALGSAVYDNALDDIEASIDRELRKQQAETIKQVDDKKKVWREVASALNSRGNELATPAEYGISVMGYDDDQQVPANELLDAYKSSEINKGALVGQRRVAESTFDSIDRTIEGMEATSRSRAESATRKDVAKATSSPEVTSSNVAYDTQRGLTEKNVGDTSIAGQLLMVQKKNAVKSKINTIDANAMNGEYPLGVERIMDDEGNEISFFDLTPEQRQDKIKEAKTAVYDAALNDLIEMEGEEKKKQEAKAAERSKNIDMADIMDTADSMRVPPNLKIKAKVPEFMEVNISKALSGDPKYHNYLISMPRDRMMGIMKELSQAVKDQRFTWVGDSELGKKVQYRQGLSSEDSESIDKFLKETDKYTPYTLGEIQSYNPKTGLFPDRKITRDADSLIEIPFTYNSEDEAKQIVEEMRKHYPIYTRSMLEQARLKPKQFKEAND